MPPEIEKWKHIGDWVDGKLVCRKDCPSEAHKLNTMTYQYQCPSYYDDNNVLQDCTCGKCGKAPEEDCKCELDGFQGAVSTQHCKIHGTPGTELKNWFEANYLDGDEVQGGQMTFQLPCEWRRFQEVLKKQDVRRWDEDEYCYKVAWANIKDWVEAQMALYETQMVSMPQIFLPFVRTKNGQTLFELVATNPSNYLLDKGD